jgi:hypothetical protein
MPILNELRSAFLLCALNQIAKVFHARIPSYRKAFTMCPSDSVAKLDTPRFDHLEKSRL